MTVGLGTAGTGDGGPVTPDKIDEPQEFICKDHMRLHEITETMDRLSHAEPGSLTGLADMLRVLERDLVDLLGEDDDELEPILDRLHAEHVSLNMQVPGPCRIVNAMHDPMRGATRSDAEALATFADDLRRHLVAENAIILPLAKARLTAGDITRLRENMIRQRVETVQD